jgi:alpha-methylacyl-CoA racemase
MRPLDGVKVIEMAGLAPSAYCGMILADFGADVMIVDRLSKDTPEAPNVMGKSPFNRGKRSIRLDAKTDQGLAILRKIIQVSDVLLEPYRPGVMEKLGLGPEEVSVLNPGIIYARLTGWGQRGPYAGMAGHDINFISLSGALSLFRRKGERPLPSCNIVGDFAGGAVFCAMGILLALIERSQSGKGQVVDAAMVDGAVNLCTFFYGLLGNHLMTLDIGTNKLDGGAPYYQVYETADGKFMGVGALEERFYKELLKGLNLMPSSLPPKDDRDKWSRMTNIFAETFKTKTREEWTAIFDGKDACVTPVLELDEVSRHPHNRERGLLMDLEGVLQPAPAPRLSRTPGKVKKPGKPRGSETREILKEIGYSPEEIGVFYEKKVVE